MPVYEYLCKECGKPMEIRATVAEYSAGLTLQCPGCGSEKVVRTISAVGVLTGSGSPSRGPACGPGSGSGCC